MTRIKRRILWSAILAICLAGPAASQAHGPLIIPPEPKAELYRTWCSPAYRDASMRRWCYDYVAQEARDLISSEQRQGRWRCAVPPIGRRQVEQIVSKLPDDRPELPWTHVLLREAILDTLTCDMR